MAHSYNSLTDADKMSKYPCPGEQNVSLRAVCVQNIYKSIMSSSTSKADSESTPALQRGMLGPVDDLVLQFGQVVAEVVAVPRDPDDQQKA